MVVLSRKSWVTAIPMEAKAREVRSQAKKVRSGERKWAKLCQDKMKETPDLGREQRERKQKEENI